MRKLDYEFIFTCGIVAFIAALGMVDKEYRKRFGDDRQVHGQRCHIRLSGNTFRSHHIVE